MLIAKEKVKGMFDKKNHLRKQLDTIVTPQTNILLWIRVAHGLPPRKILWVMFVFIWVSIRHHISWENSAFLRILSERSSESN